MNAWYICSSKVLIITSPGLLLKFTDIKCLHPLCAKIFRPITLKKLLSYIMLADSEHAKNNLISSLVKKDLAALLPTAAFSSLIFHWLIKIYYEVLKIIIFPWSFVMALYLLIALRLHAEQNLWSRTVYDKSGLEHVLKKAFQIF